MKQPAVRKNQAKASHTTYPHLVDTLSLKFKKFKGSRATQALDDQFRRWNVSVRFP
jgi:hypothetical protein